MRFVRLWFTDVLGTEELRHHARRAGDRARGGHDLRRLGDRGLHPGPGVRHAAPCPTRTRSRSCRGGATTRQSRGMFRDIEPRVRGAVRGRSSQGAQAQPRARATRASRSTSRPRWSSSSSSRPDEPEPLDHAGFFDLTQLDMVSNLRRQTIVTLEAMGIPVEYRFHELGPEPARDRLRIAPRAHDGRQRDDVPAGPTARSRRTSASTRRSCRSRSRARSDRACTTPPLAVRGRRQRVPRHRATRTACRRWASSSSRACCVHRG